MTVIAADVAADAEALAKLDELRALCAARPGHLAYLEAAMLAPLPGGGPIRPRAVSPQAASAILTDVDWIRGWRPPNDWIGAYAAWKTDRDAAAARAKVNAAARAPKPQPPCSG